MTNNQKFHHFKPIHFVCVCVCGNSNFMFLFLVDKFDGVSQVHKMMWALSPCKMSSIVLQMALWRCFSLLISYQKWGALKCNGHFNQLHCYALIIVIIFFLWPIVKSCQKSPPFQIYWHEYVFTLHLSCQLIFFRFARTQNLFALCR